MYGKERHVFVLCNIVCVKSCGCLWSLQRQLRRLRLLHLRLNEAKDRGGLVDAVSLESSESHGVPTFSSWPPSHLRTSSFGRAFIFTPKTIHINAGFGRQRHIQASDLASFTRLSCLTNITNFFPREFKNRAISTAYVCSVHCLQPYRWMADGKVWMKKYVEFLLRTVE